MDWIAGTGWATLFLAVAVYGAFAAWRFAHGIFYVSPRAPSWEAYFFGTLGTLMCFLVRERHLRIMLGFIALGPVVQIACYWLGGPAAQRALAPGLALIDLGVIVLGLVLLVSWIRERAKLV